MNVLPSNIICPNHCTHLKVDGTAPTHCFFKLNVRESFSEDSRFFFTSKCLTEIAAVWFAKKNDLTYQDIIFKGQVQTAKCDKSSPIFSQGPNATHSRRCAFQNRLDLQTKCGDYSLRDETLQHLGCIWNILWKPLISIGAVSYLSTRCISWLQMASLAIFSTVQNRSTHTYFISHK